MEVVVCKKCGNELPGPSLGDCEEPEVPEYQKEGFCSEDCKRLYKENNDQDN